MATSSDRWPLKLTLLQAPDDPPVNSPEIQQEIAAVGRGLHASGVPYTQRGMAFDAVDAVGYGLPEFALAIAPDVIHAIEAVLIAWIGARARRFD